jgi:hypothetical protein
MTTDRAKRYTGPSIEPPHDGEQVLFCSCADVDNDHIHIEGVYEWFLLDKSGEPQEVRNRVTGDRFDCRWAAICEQCFIRWSKMRRRNLSKVLARNAPWIGEPPVINRIQ